MFTIDQYVANFLKLVLTSSTIICQLFYIGTSFQLKTRIWSNFGSATFECLHLFALLLLLTLNGYDYLKNILKDNMEEFMSQQIATWSQ